MTTTLDIVLVNWHASDLIAACLGSLPAAFPPGVRCTVTVVDNSCDEGESQRLARDSAGARILTATQNLGFAQGSNVGAKAGSAHHLLFLNPDTLLLPTSLGEPLRLLESHGGNAIVGPRQITDVDGTFTIAPMRGAALWDDVRDLLYDRGWWKTRSIELLRKRTAILDSNEPVSVPWVSGGALFVGRQAFERLGGFDPAYFMYVEDSDLCLRARRRGLPVLFHPNVRVVHRLEGSVRNNRARVNRAIEEGHLRFSRKNYGRCLSNLERAAAALTRTLVPRRENRWKTATLLSSATAPRIATGLSSHLRAAIEIARSPLFDNALTAYTRNDQFQVGADLWSWLPEGHYFLRTAVEESPGVWHETSLRSLEKPTLHGDPALRSAAS